MGSNRLTPAARRLPAFGMIALNDAPAPAVRLRIGDRGLKNRTVALLAVKLRTRNQRKTRLDREPIRVGEPSLVIFERGAFSGALLVVSQDSDRPGFVAQEYANGSVHSDLAVVGGRTRLGMRC